MALFAYKDIIKLIIEQVNTFSLRDILNIRLVSKQFFLCVHSCPSLWRHITLLNYATKGNIPVAILNAIILYTKLLIFVIDEIKEDLSNVNLLLSESFLYQKQIKEKFPKSKKIIKIYTICSIAAKIYERNRFTCTIASVYENSHFKYQYGRTNIIFYHINVKPKEEIYISVNLDGKYKRFRTVNKIAFYDKVIDFEAIEEKYKNIDDYEGIKDLFVDHSEWNEYLINMYRDGEFDFE
jgi:hypothetical protein